MSIMEKEVTGKREMTTIEIIGLVMVGAAVLGILFIPEHLAGAFNAMATRIKTSVFDVFIMGSVGVAIIASVITGRILERLGFTDALIRIFVPYAKKIGVNSAVVIPAVYNILGDINAAGRIAGPTLKKANATKDEQKIAVATMVQSQQSFSTFMFGLLAFSLGGVKAFPVIIVALLLPLLVVPLLLSKTIYRNTKPVSLDVLPKFTPETGFAPTLFGAAREGAELLFLLIVPAAAAVFAVIGILEYAGVWQPIQNGLAAVLTSLSIHAETGIISVMVSPTLAMATMVNQLKEAVQIAPNLIIGSWILASSGFPIGVALGQIPTVWAGVSDLSESEAMQAVILGLVMRIITAAAAGLLLTPLIVK
ncbi:MAG: hypothetical protein HPY70_10840 [Firmicutes bacterium]|nr:hypothetical protein [Bacillota bacterium]